MSAGIYMILIQNLILMMTCTIFVFCAAKKTKKQADKKTEKTGKSMMSGTKSGTTSGATNEATTCPEIEKEKPPIAKPVVRPLEHNDEVDENGYAINEKLNEDLATLKYLEKYSPPQTGRYNMKEIEALEDKMLDEKYKSNLTEKERDHFELDQFEIIQHRHNWSHLQSSNDVIQMNIQAKKEAHRLKQEETRKEEEEKKKEKGKKKK